MKHIVTLTTEELLSLDGKCSLDVQEQINCVKISTGDVLIDAVMSSIRKNKKFESSPRFTGIICKCCGKAPTHTLFKSGKRKGEVKEYGKHLTYCLENPVSGRYLHVCAGCFDKAIPALKELLKDVQAQLPKFLRGSIAYKFFTAVTCSNCKWEGFENELGKLPCLLGDGYYLGECPSCKAQNSMFVGVIKRHYGTTKLMEDTITHTLLGR
jgi:predicted nucleic-acid-binding Zn-ribbon protein